MKIPSLSSFRIVIVCSLCLLLITPTAVQASEQIFEKTNNDKMNITLFYETLKYSLPSLFFDEKSNEYFGVDENKKEYFTLRLNKQEKFKASYENKAYFIYYSKNW